ncbi:uncharacterized protein LOC143519880 isoform X2 [Brachyhypopomus gauderio]|uniref:uncharacterized protein LOC143519880 isoform X2 n=1 Tax=Brachyhypopomus gauderio TaxID=698409 RepID=UPI004043373A
MVYTTEQPHTYTTNNMTFNASTAKPDVGMGLPSEDEHLWIIVYVLVAVVLVLAVLVMVICRYSTYQRGTYRTHEPMDQDTDDVILLKNDPALQDTLYEGED